MPSAVGGTKGQASPLSRPSGNQDVANPRLRLLPAFNAPHWTVLFNGPTARSTRQPSSDSRRSLTDKCPRRVGLYAEHRLTGG